MDAQAQKAQEAPEKKRVSGIWFGGGKRARARNLPTAGAEHSIMRLFEIYGQATFPKIQIRN